MARHEVTYLPSGRSTRVPEGTSLFSAAHWIGLAIESSCGGRGTCGKCKVRIVGDAEITDADHRELPPEDLAEGWRLSCTQIVRADAVCHVPEVMRRPKAATMGLHRMVVLEPNVVRVPLTLAPSTVEDPRDDVERLREALHAEGYGLDAHDLDTLRLVPAAIRDRDEVSAVLCGGHLVAVEPADAPDRRYGVAVDLGTTTVVATAMDLTSGMAVGVASDLNRQARFGADVISRIGHAMQGADQLEEVRLAAVGSVQGVMDDALAEAGLAREQVHEVVVVGNATMLHLLLGVDAKQIAVSPFAPVFREPLDLPATAVEIQIHPRGRVALLPALGAYVGADIVGGVLATGLARESGVRLLVDVGTNGEMVLNAGERTVATSAPAGPAFEGAQIFHGMRAADGAIEAVSIGETVEVKVIGDAEPRGICGSGLIDAVAQLRLAGLLATNGRLRSADEAAEAGSPVADRLFELHGQRAFRLTDDVVLTQRDVRELQVAKAAMEVGMRALMETLGVGADDLEQVLLAGSFGTYINAESALAIGLVPPVPVERVVAAGNAAGEGAKMCLLSFRERMLAHDLPRRVEYLELSARPDFNDEFVAATVLPELAGDA